MLVKKEDNHKFNKNNSGFTLLELLISVAILALIVIPILNSFLLSARLNAKANQKHRATMVAENIMEKLKGNTLDEIVTWRDITENLTVDDVRKYRLESYINQGSQYNVEIKMDPTSALYKNGVDKQLINDYSFPVIAEVYGDSNAIISQNDEDNVAAQMFLQYSQLANPDTAFKDTDEVKKSMKKYMQIVILKGTKANHVVVEATFMYRCDTPNLPVDNQIVELGVYSKDIENLNSIYLFYDSLDHNNSDAIQQDNLLVNNRDAKAVANVYIVKRGETKAATNYVLNAKNTTYNGKSISGIADRQYGKSNLTFYSNLSQSSLGNVDLNPASNTNTLAPNSGVKINRIYDVTVTVYKKGNWSDPLVEFTTTKEEW
ncbi:type IV pilus modification PilV family protein [Anaerosporobacter sp.]